MRALFVPAEIAHRGTRDRRPTEADDQAAPLYARWKTAWSARIGVLADTLSWTPDQPSHTGSDERLVALRAGAPVDVPLSALPRWARAGEELRWWRRATVAADGAVTFYDDDGSAWLAENGL